VKTPEWERFEQDVQEILHLDSTIASGSKHYDQGDAVDKRHPSESNFRFIADAKYTNMKSFSLDMKMLRQWVKRAQEDGKRFCLPLRFGEKDEDYIVLTLDDFAEILEVARTTEVKEKSDWEETVERLVDMATYNDQNTASSRLFLLELSKKLGEL